MELSGNQGALVDAYRMKATNRLLCDRGKITRQMYEYANEKILANIDHLGTLCYNELHIKGGIGDGFTGDKASNY